MTDPAPSPTPAEPPLARAARAAFVTWMLMALVAAAVLVYGFASSVGDVRATAGSFAMLFGMVEVTLGVVAATALMSRRRWPRRSTGAVLVVVLVLSAIATLMLGGMAWTLFGIVARGP